MTSETRTQQMDPPEAARKVKPRELERHDSENIRNTDREDKIRARAHRIWEDLGQPENQHHQHWEQASREIDAEDGAPSSSDNRPPEENSAVSDLQSESTGASSYGGKDIASTATGAGKNKLRP